MRKLIASTFASLDGIMHAPGGPEEDPTGSFALGGWMFGYDDESMDISAIVPGGDVQPGSFASAEPSEMELARRKKMANETW